MSLGVTVEVSFPPGPGPQQPMVFLLRDDMRYQSHTSAMSAVKSYIPQSGAWATDWGSRLILYPDGATCIEIRGWDATYGMALIQLRTPTGTTAIVGSWRCLAKPLPASGSGVWVGLAGKISGGLPDFPVVGADCIGGCVVSIDRSDVVLFTALDAHVGIDWGGSGSLVAVLITGYKEPWQINGAMRSGVDVAFSLGAASAWIKEVAATAQAAAVEAKAGAQAIRAEQLIASVLNNSGALVRNFKNIVNAACIDWERKKLTTFSGMGTSMGTEVGIFYYAGYIKVLKVFNRYLGSGR